MSDYAGVIGGVVGAVIGSFVPGVGTAWGWAIGSALGNAYAASQQVLPGPKIGDIQRQTSQEGGFRPIVFGRSQPISGNVIADSEPVIVKREEDAPGGKGGPKVETEYAYRTYAVGFCEGETTLLQAWRNGILVFNDEDDSMEAENAKFLEYATWYTGTFDQMPDPDLEGIYGVDNTPFFRGTSYLVLAGEDVTDQRGAWSQWQVRVFRGASKRITSTPYPVDAVAGIQTASAPKSAVLFNNPSARAQTSAVALDGELRDILQRVTLPAATMSTEGIALAGELRDVLVPLDSVAELDTEAVARDGVLHDTVIPYEWPDEEIATTAVAINGTIT